ncbi:MAG: hypothetical protein ACE5KD_02945 [Candidatus Bathyarchaeia archaeon]
MSEVTDYLREKIAQVSFARFVGEIVCALGSSISVVGLFLKILVFIIIGFSLLFVGLYLSVHYELQRLDYTYALRKIEQHEK